MATKRGVGGNVRRERGRVSGGSWLYLSLVGLIGGCVCVCVCGGGCEKGGVVVVVGVDVDVDF